MSQLNAANAEICFGSGANPIDIETPLSNPQSWLLPQMMNAVPRQNYGVMGSQEYG